LNTNKAMQHYFSNLVGWLELCVSDRGVTSISFIEEPSEPVPKSAHPMMKKLEEELVGYFSGKLTTFSIPVALTAGSPFQRRVWKQLELIPYGETRSYADIARDVGNPRGCRAVGGANGSNPVPIVVPCHRVIKADGSIGGFSSGVHIKRKLLALEGVVL
jgi:methylated-DNA-[protein]-cysteine S-methyltransferase